MKISKYKSGEWCGAIFGSAKGGKCQEIKKSNQSESIMAIRRENISHKKSYLKQHEKDYVLEFHRTAVYYTNGKYAKGIQGGMLK